MRLRPSDAPLQTNSNRKEQIDRVRLLKGIQPTALRGSPKIELLVMGTVCRTGVAGFIMGNATERVLDQVNRSVLTIKPEWFQVPAASGRPVSQTQR